jgi:hypothetical protein
MEFYLAIKKTKLYNLLENEWSMLSEINQSHKNKYCMFSLICRARGKQDKTTKIMEVKWGLLGRLKREGKKGKEEGGIRE